MLIKAEPDVVRRGVEALAKGPDQGVLVAVPEDLGAETEEEAAALAAARARGVFVGVMSIDELMRWVPGDGHNPDEIAGILRQLRRPPPEGQVHVLGVMQGCVATLTARADAALAAARDRDDARMDGIARLLSMAEPKVLRRAGEAAVPATSVFVVGAPDDPAVTRLRGVTQSALEAARDEGVYVGLHDATTVIAALPLEGLETEDALRAARRLTSPVPQGSVRVVAVHDGQITIVTARPEPGRLTLK